MGKLTIINHKGINVTDSREVAVMTRKEHKNLLRDIKGYVDILESSKLSSQEFFIPSAYTNSQNKEQPCYLLTRKGCDMVANKMTGEKGVLFTAEYVTRFEEIEKQVQGFNLIVPQNYKEALLALVAAEEEKEKLQLANRQKDQVIGELRPKADYTDLILKNKGLVTITQIAKDYGMSGNKMDSTLHELGVQYKQSGQWLLYSKHHGKGYTHSETVNITHSDGRPDVKMNTKWTQKGRLFLYDLLKENGMLPDIEKGFEEIVNTLKH